MNSSRCLMKACFHPCLEPMTTSVPSTVSPATSHTNGTRITKALNARRAEVSAGAEEASRAGGGNRTALGLRGAREALARPERSEEKGTLGGQVGGPGSVDILAGCGSAQ